MSLLRSMLVLGLLVLAAAVAAVAPAQAADRCAPAIADIGAALDLGDLERAKGLYLKDMAAVVCDDERTFYCEGQLIGLRYLDAAQSALEKGTDEGEVGAMLDGAVVVGPPWQMLALKGDVELTLAQRTKA